MPDEVEEKRENSHSLLVSLWSELLSKWDWSVWVTRMTRPIATSLMDPFLFMLEAAAYPCKWWTEKVIPQIRDFQPVITSRLCKACTSYSVYQSQIMLNICVNIA
jgi:hypothetical protein